MKPIHPHHRASADPLVTDEYIRALKKRQLKQLRGNSLLVSAADTFKFMAGILTMGAMALVLPPVVEAITAGAALTTALSAAPVVGLVMLAGAAIATGAAVASSYNASRIWQAGQFDNYEISAQSTARHLVKEIQANNMCMTQERSDGKTWVQALEAQKASERGHSL